MKGHIIAYVGVSEIASHFESEPGDLLAVLVEMVATNGDVFDDIIEEWVAETDWSAREQAVVSFLRDLANALEAQHAG